MAREGRLPSGKPRVQTDDRGGGRVCLVVWSRYIVTTRIKPGDSY